MSLVQGGKLTMTVYAMITSIKCQATKIRQLKSQKNMTITVTYRRETSLYPRRKRELAYKWACEQVC